jgi:hypothetical protein
MGVYEELELHTVINASGTLTRLGAVAWPRKCWRP